MNYKQAAVVMFAVLLAAMSVLTPPYNYEDHHNSNETSAGFHLFTAPPKVKSYPEMQKIFSIPDGEPPHGFSVKKDRLRLFCEWLGILFAAFGGLFLTANRRTWAKIIIGGFFLSIGLFFAGLVVLASGIFRS